MALDLGELLGSVDLVITPFERKYAQVVGMMSKLGVQAERSGAQTAALDSGLAGVADSSNAASASLTRTNTALREAGVSASDAAAPVSTLSALPPRTVDATTELGLAQSKYRRRVAADRRAGTPRRTAGVRARRPLGSSRPRRRP
jgi:hypothetical protein